MKVMKFGGSSVENTSAMLNVFEIVLKETGKRLVILSACKGITDLLIEAANLATNDLPNCYSKIEFIEKHHKKIIDDIITSNKKRIALKQIDVLIENLRTYAKGINFLQDITPKMLDYFMSFGEKLSTTVFYYIAKEKKLNTILINSEDFIKTNNSFGNAIPDLQKIKQVAKEKLFPIFNNYDVIIAQGFIGSDEEGNTTTLGRGGSDFSAALYGYATDASEIQIWTDVSGVKSADPRFINEAITINEMSIDEVRELSFYGAKVLHPDTIKPAIEAGILIKVLNTFSPKDTGTIIKNSIVSEEPKIHSVTVLNNVSKVKFHFKPATNSNIQMTEIFQFFSQKNFKILSSAQSETSLVVFTKTSNDDLNLIKANFIDYKVEILNGALICIIGNNISLEMSIFSKIINKVKNYNVDYICTGINKQSIFLFTLENTKEIVKHIHKLIRS